MDVLLLATQRWEKPNITGMADTAIESLILCFEAPLVKVGIEATSLKKSGVNGVQANIVQDGYCTNWWELGSRPKRRPVIYAILIIITTSFMLY